MFIQIIFTFCADPNYQKFYIQIYSNIIICSTPVTESIYSFLYKTSFWFILTYFILHCILNCPYVHPYVLLDVDENTNYK